MSAEYIIMVKTDTLTPHPLNEKLYGEAGKSRVDQENWFQLRRSIAKNGILEPIVVSNFEINGKEDTWILSGHRRWLAARELALADHNADFAKVPVRVVELEGLEAEKFLIESNRQRVKSKEQLGREYSNLKRIEKELAKQRQVANLKKGAEAPVKANSPEREKGQARDIAAAKVGLKPKTADTLEKLVDAADAGNQKARAALDAVNAGTKSVSGAAKEVIDPPPPKPPRDDFFDDDDARAAYERRKHQREKEDETLIADMRTIVAAGFRALANVHRPDKGGTDQRMVQLNAAKDALDRLLRDYALDRGLE